MKLFGGIIFLFNSAHANVIFYINVNNFQQIYDPKIYAYIH